MRNSVHVTVHVTDAHTHMKRSYDDNTPTPAASRPRTGGAWDGPHELWHTASKVLASVLRNGSLKSILAPMPSERAKPVNALVTETLKRRELLERVVQESGPWSSTSGHELRLLLAHEMLFGHGLRQSALLRPTDDDTLAETLSRMRSWEATLLKSAKAHAREAGVTDDADGNGGLAEQQQQQQQQSQAARLPRYVRVNTLKMTLDAAVAVLCAEGWTHVPVPMEGIPSAPPEPPLFWVDPHVPSLLVMPPETELHEHALVQSSALILQDKASCLAPAALAPRPGELILDCCAAPGNKTTQLAALSAPNGLVIACERDARRAGVLRARAAQAAGSAIRVMQIDFLSIDVKESPYCDVTAVQLDPTCSGSGMVERAGFQLAPEGGAAAVDGGQAERLAALGAMQLELVLHALSFPKARVVVYSTCSVHPVEDELVVRAALRAPAVRRAGWRLAPALPQWPCRGLPLLPDAHMLVRAGPEVCTNGFFVARFERASV